MFTLDWIIELNVWANNCRLILDGVEDDLDWRTVSAYNLEKNGGIGWIAYYNRLVLSNLIEAMQHFVYGQTSSVDYQGWYYVHRGLYDKEVDVTWKTIVEAWLKNDFEGRAPTIAVIDRMRQILWDEPFSAVWAARPEEQPL
ncbi:unnamed protein product [marine sediment metagenome]|uniref:Uncharacterized protein n=1 Tax=marine sediment metagenome TaxID=412755 RepID=X0Z6S5_9ZZZZ